MSVKLKPGVIADVPVAQLEADPLQPRKSFEKPALEQLGESMKARVLHPLIVRQDGKKTIIVDGERRWRAAKIAKIKTLPCLLQSFDALELRGAQLATSEHREQLNTMEIAAFLVDLQKREKKSTNELLAALAKMGVNDVGATKLDKLMKLTELPDWLQTHVREGTLSASAAAEALPILGWHCAGSLWQSLKRQIENAMHWRGSMTAKELRDDVHGAFTDYGIDLDDKYGEPENIRAFAIDVCLKCEFYKKIGNVQLCMNPAEFRKKNDEALTLKAQREAEREAKKAERAKKPGARDNPDPTQVEPRELKTSKEGLVVLKQVRREYFRALDSAAFDTTDCQKCPHRKAASHDGTKKAGDAGDVCTHPPCFNHKTEADKRFLSRKQRAREYFEAWLRPRVLTVAPSRLDENATYGLVLWLASCAPENASKWFSSQRDRTVADTTNEHFIRKFKLIDLQGFVDLGENKLTNEHWHEMIRIGVRVMTREQLRWFAQHLGIELEHDETRFRIDEDYLRLKRKSELEALAKLSGMETIKGLGVADLKRELLMPERIEKIGVPADIEGIYREPFLENDPEDDDLDLDEEEFDEDLDEEEADELADAGAAIAEHVAATPAKKKRGK